MLKKCLLLAAIFVTGCATTAKYEGKLQSWVGSSEASLVQSWGPPSSVYNLPDGGKILTYVVSNGQMASTSYNQFTKTLNTSTYSNSCQTDFTLDSLGKITTWRWQGNACKSD